MYQKIISFVIPCYNSAQYMDKCIKQLVDLNSNNNDDVEIIIVDDGSENDNTLEIAEDWEGKYPYIIKVIHQENGGHGQAVNTGLQNATGLYFKVVDSDDWLDVRNTRPIINYLRTQNTRQNPTDLVIGNYVYNKVHERKQTPINYLSAFHEKREIAWRDVKHFKKSQYLLMHSIIYRTQLLRDINLVLPKHTFYVDNIFAYVPLPKVKSIYYMNKNMYMYYIGREDQSVNEKVMMSRIDQQLKITKIMIDNTHLEELDREIKLRKYMLSYLSMMMCICSVFLRKIGGNEAEYKRSEIWQYIEAHDPKLKKKVFRSPLCWATNIPTPVGKFIAIVGYKIAQKLFKFN